MEIGRKIVTWGVVLAALGSFGAFCHAELPAGRRLVAGRAAKEFPLEISGKPGRLSTTRQRLSAEFLGHWCPPCVEETPGLNRPTETHRFTQWRYPGVAADEDTALTRNFCGDQGVLFPTTATRLPKIITRRSLNLRHLDVSRNVHSSIAKARSRANSSAFNSGIRRKCSLLRRNSRGRLVLFLARI